jgi:hypothetical protein
MLRAEMYTVRFRSSIGERVRYVARPKDIDSGRCSEQANSYVAGKLAMSVAVALPELSSELHQRLADESRASNAQRRFPPTDCSPKASTPSLPTTRSTMSCMARPKPANALSSFPA